MTPSGSPEERKEDHHEGLPRIGVPLAALAVAGCIGLVLLAIRAAADERTWYHDLSPAEINALVQARGFRIVNLRTNPGAGPTRFDVVVIADTGERPWSWSYDLTSRRMQALLEASPRRPVVLVRYEVAPGDARLTILRRTHASWARKHGCPRSPEMALEKEG